jgi:hypothetical protein
VAYGYLDLLAFWAYPEALPYDYTYNRGEISLPGFQCPLLLTPGEAGDVSIRIKNKSDRQLHPYIQFLVSEPGQKKGITRPTEYFELAPGETKEFTQQLLADNTMLNSVIQVRILIANDIYTPAASMTRHCPVFVYQLGDFSGTQILLLISALVILFCAAGIWQFWKFSPQRMKRTRLTNNRLAWLAAMVTITMLLNILELYFLALMCMLLTFFMILSTIDNEMLKSIDQ